jgi:putative transposase
MATVQRIITVNTSTNTGILAAWRDNVFVERFWKTLKYEEVYWRAHETVSEARESIRRYIAFYNQRRPYRALKGQAPGTAYFGNLSIRQAA